ncbi:acyltransferase family protein [Altererythrobacter sp. CAU 1778]
MIAPPLDGRDVPQLHALTGLRGLAAWMVVLYHVRGSLTQLLPGEAIEIFAKGYLAVDLFFMLSGFVMWLNYGPRFRANGFGEVRGFWWKRFARIWPLHALVLLGMIGFVLALIGTGRDTAGYPLEELPLHILLLQNWGFTGALSWNHPAWSISTEMAAYVIFPVLACLVPWERLRPAILLLIVAMLFAVLATGFLAMGYATLGEDIPRMGLIRCLAEFSAGIALCALWQQWRGREGAAFWCLAAFAVLGIVATELSLPEVVFAPAVLASLMLSLALDTGRISQILGGRVLRWLGDVSYATYLTHFFVFVLFKIAFVGSDMQIGWGGLALYLGTVLGASAMLYHNFEKPAQRWLNSRAPAFARFKRAATPP